MNYYSPYIKEEPNDDYPFMSKKADNFKDIMVFIDKKPFMKESKYDLDDYCDMDYSYPKKTSYTEHSQSICDVPMKDMNLLSDFMPKPELYKKEMDKQYMHQDFIKMLQLCSGTCYKLMNDLLDSEECKRRNKQIRLLHECAKICDSQAIFTLIDSHFVKEHAKLCAVVCETCGEVCRRHPDAASQHCAKICLECAESCRRFIRM